jgi:hypothetical protein
LFLLPGCCSIFIGTEEAEPEGPPYPAEGVKVTVGEAIALQCDDVLWKMANPSLAAFCDAPTAFSPLNVSNR